MRFPRRSRRGPAATGIARWVGLPPSVPCVGGFQRPSAISQRVTLPRNVGERLRAEPGRVSTAARHSWLSGHGLLSNPCARLRRSSRRLISSRRLTAAWPATISVTLLRLMRMPMNVPMAATFGKHLQGKLPGKRHFAKLCDVLSNVPPGTHRFPRLQGCRDRDRLLGERRLRPVLSVGRGRADRPLSGHLQSCRQAVGGRICPRRRLDAPLLPHCQRLKLRRSGRRRSARWTQAR